jgi:SAM-dependent methyltransferase
MDIRRKRQWNRNRARSPETHIRDVFRAHGPSDRQGTGLGLAICKRIVKSADVVYDLGCGDGRIVIAAAKHFGARGVGIDIDPERIREARANAKNSGVENRVRFEEADLFTADIHEATVVTLFLLSTVNQRLAQSCFRSCSLGCESYPTRSKWGIGNQTRNRRWMVRKTGPTSAGSCSFGPYQRVENGNSRTKD